MTARIPLIAALLFMAGASPALAQRITTPYRFFEETQAAGLTVAYFSTDQGSLGIGPKSGTAFGGRYHIRLSGPFFVEAEALYLPTTRAVVDTVVVDSAFTEVGEADIGLAVVHASMRFNLTGQRTWNNILPFVLLGVGAAIEAKGDDEADADILPTARTDFGTTFAGQFGAGIEWFPVERVAIRADLRNVFWQLKTPEGLQFFDLGRPVPAEEWANNLTTSIGISVHF